MDRIGVRRLATAAFVFLSLAATPAIAEVKLRIYLQDGSLQSGNLISETPEAFVILGKDGRSEIQKKSIMFINGKTLKQWEDRPDKLFQTEIMPSELPNPAFVNDKAPLPRPPEVKSVQPLQLKSVEKAAAATAAVPAPREAPVEKAAAPAPKPVREKARTRAARKASDSAPVAAAAAPATAPGPRSSNRRLQERAAKGASHRERGFRFLQGGEKGRAAQEFLIARLLEPDHGDTYLALARLYHEAGLTEPALKYLEHWTLRKSEDAAKEAAAIKLEIEQKKKDALYLQIGAVAGAFSWVPVLLLMRRFRRRRAAAPAVEEEEVEDVETAPVETTPAWVAEAEAVFSEPESPVAAEAPALPLPPPPKNLPTPPAPVFRAPPPPIVAKPAPPEPVINLPAPEPPPPVFEPAPVAFKPAPEPVKPEPVEPEPVEPPPAEREPIFESMPDEAPDPQAIVSMARSVENSLIRGNAAAEAGRVDVARRFYRTALALNADCASAHLGLGYLAFLEEKWDTSLLHYRKALDIDPSSADAHYGAARVLLEANRMDEAVPELRATLTLDPTYGDARDALTAINKPA